MLEIYNLRHKSVPLTAIYIGQPGPFGNPFTHLPAAHDKWNRRGLFSVLVPSVDDAIARYRTWMRQQPALLERIQRELFGRDLACWCKPGPCHGDVIFEWLYSLLD